MQDVQLARFFLRLETLVITFSALIENLLSLPEGDNKLGAAVTRGLTTKKK